MITETLTDILVTLTEKWISKDENRDVGTCFTGALVLQDSVYVPNVGDSRVLLVKEKATYQLTRDAKPNHPVFERTVTD